MILHIKTQWQYMKFCIESSNVYNEDVLFSQQALGYPRSKNPAFWLGAFKFGSDGELQKLYNPQGYFTFSISQSHIF